MAAADTLDTLRDRYGRDWEIEQFGGRVRARHRTEKPDRKREQATLLLTEVTAEHPRLLADRLAVQDALRRELGARRRP